MNEQQHITWLESRLEQMVEGTFTNLFGKRISTHEIALQLARSLEDNRRNPEGSDPRPIVPDLYAIFLDAQIVQHLATAQPELPQVLSSHLVELAKQLGYRLLHTPEVSIQILDEQETAKLLVKASFQDSQNDSTAIMQPIKASMAIEKPINAQLVINNKRTIQLTSDVTNIGRNHSNEIILDDSAISRHHLQIRLRFGAYTLFDIPGKNTTFVNNVAVNHHKLQSGDVIQVGSTQIVYFDDNKDSSSNQENTDILDPV